MMSAFLLCPPPLTRARLLMLLQPTVTGGTVCGKRALDLFCYRAVGKQR
jgi:hypothetical protein